MSGHLFEVTVQFWVEDGEQDEMRAKLRNPRGSVALIDEGSLIDGYYVDNIVIDPVEIRNIKVDGN